MSQNKQEGISSEALSQSETFRLEGNDFFKQGKYELAIEKYTEALKLNPQSHLSISNRCQCYIKLKNKAKAVQDGELLVKLKDDWPKGWYRLANAYELAKEYKKAADSYLKCYNLDNNLDVAKRRYDACITLSQLSKEVLEQLESQNGTGAFDLNKAGQLLFKDKFLQDHVKSKMMETYKIRQNPEESTEKIKKLEQKSEIWFISWSTTPEFHKGERMYMISVDSATGHKITGDQTVGEPKFEDILMILQSAMLNPMDFRAPRRPQTIGFAYRMHPIYDQIKQFLDEVNVQGMLEPLSEAKRMAKETGNHYLGLNHLIYEKNN